ncbi:hypothetical protein MPL1032_140001 [Mesorhizobium plurifarium]|uniref:Uncharacterized protein n=1 Tax=Mesorhizobium plurifarium TaxID=69974 RepID=A0A0K2VRS4_MESPL|nr:hypothetical protein MPL1032_140001 [Mesorhizobium plurifarium]
MAAVVWALFLRLAEPTSFIRYQRDRDCHHKHDQRPNHHVCGQAPAATLSHPFSPTIGLIGALVFPQAIPQSRPSAAGANVAGCKGAEQWEEMRPPRWGAMRAPAAGSDFPTHVLRSVFAGDGYMSYRGTIFGDRSSWAIFAAWKIVMRT